MRLVGRNDLVLIAGLFIAVFVIFSKPLAQLLEYVRQIEDAHGLQLLPALVILATFFSFHQLRKRQESRAEALVAARAAHEATERAEELSRLVALGHALSRSLDRESIQAAAAAHIPLLAPGRGAWAMIRTRGQWEPFVTIGDSEVADRERAARRALGEAEPLVAVDAADLCFPLIIGGTPMGVLGVGAHPAPSTSQRSVLTAAASMLAVSLKNAELFREVRDNSVRDALTGCFNKAHALEVLEAELRRARRSHMPLSVLMFDLDDFKGVNDRYGHLCGDAVLSAVGARMRAVLRGSDLKCRYGGEEFLIVLPDTPLQGARRVADTLRKEIADHPVQWNEQTVGVTASFGVTSIEAGEVDSLAVIARADAALYRAKQDGRNAVRAAEDQPALLSARQFPHPA
jgi:diguanylate cyclase (GGDEF)-like protein